MINQSAGTAVASRRASHCVAAGGCCSGGAALAVADQSFATPSRRGAYQSVVGQGGLATFSGGIGWRRGFGEASTAQLGFIGGSPFVIAATPAAADPLEAGLDAQFWS